MEIECEPCSDAGQVVFDLDTTVLDYTSSGVDVKPCVDQVKPAALAAPAAAQVTPSGVGSGDADRAEEPDVDAPAAKAPRLS